MKRPEGTNPSIRDVNILYLVSMILFVVGGKIISSLKPINLNYTGQMLFLFLTQLTFVFLPVLIFIVYKRIDIKTTLRLNKVSFSNIIISSGILLVAMPIASILNAIVIIILSYFGKIHEPVNFSADNTYQLIINILVVAITPAIFEEVFFRGMVLRGYEAIGKYKAIIISAGLFALLHRDIQSLLGTFILGVVIAYIVYKTNSIITGMIAHFLNNGFIVLMTYIFGKVSKDIDKTSTSINVFNEFVNMDITTIVTVIIVVGFVLISCVGVFLALIFLLNYKTKGIVNKNVVVSNQKDNKIIAYIPLIISIMLIIEVFINQIINN